MQRPSEKIKDLNAFGGADNVFIAMKFHVDCIVEEILTFKLIYTFLTSEMQTADMTPLFVSGHGADERQSFMGVPDCSSAADPDFFAYGGK